MSIDIKIARRIKKKKHMAFSSSLVLLVGAGIFPPPVSSVAKIAASGPVLAAVVSRAAGPLPSPVSNQLRAAGPALPWLSCSS